MGENLLLNGQNVCVAYIFQGLAQSGISKSLDGWTSKLDGFCMVCMKIKMEKNSKDFRSFSICGLALTLNCYSVEFCPSI